MKHLNIISIFLSVSIILMAVVSYYWLFFEPVIVTVDNPTNIVVDKTEYKRGERITYSFDYCKTKPLTGIVNRAIVDGLRITYAEIKSDLAVGCNTVNINDLVVPDFIKNGEYYITITAEYQTNPFRRDIILLRTVNFKVTEGIPTQEQVNTQVEKNTDQIKKNTQEIEKIK